MRQIQRWVAVMAVTLLLPAMAEATAFGRRDAMMELGVSERGSLLAVHAPFGGFLHWFGGVLSAIWGAARGSIVPEDGGGNGLTVADDPTDGGV